MSKSIYVASPLGFSEAGRFWMYQQLMPMIEKVGYKVIDPWKLTPEEAIAPALRMQYGMEKRQKWQELNKLIGSNNTNGIKEASMLVAVLDGVDVDSGTAAEIGFAAALGKPVIGYRNDFRLASDNEGSIVNLQVEYFIEINKGLIVKDLVELERELRARI